MFRFSSLLVIILSAVLSCNGEANDSSDAGERNSKDDLNEGLVNAARAGKREDVSILLKSGANVQAFDKDGNSVLIVVSCHGTVELSVTGSFLHERDLLTNKVILW